MQHGTIHAFVGAKGGVGTSTTALCAAKCLSLNGSQVVIADLTGDIGVVLGCSPDLPGIANLNPETSTVLDLRSIAVDVQPHHMMMLPLGTGDLSDDLGFLWRLLSDAPWVTVVDAGRGSEAVERTASERALRRSLVMHCCYQSLTRARWLLEPNGVSSDDINDIVMLSDPTDR